MNDKVNPFGPKIGSNSALEKQGSGSEPATTTATEQAVERVLPFTATEKAALMRQDRVAEQLAKKEAAEQKFLEQLDALTTLDWEDMPVPVLATLLMSKPFKGKKDEPDKYMSPKQALIYASSIKFLNAGCLDPQRKLNPFLNDCWPDLETMKVNVTVEGQRKLASRRGDLGIPTWKLVERPIGGGIERKLPWQKADIGMECRMPIADKEVISTAWLSMWFKNTPIWRENWEHMLRVRSEGLCYEAITGVGISQAHTDKDVLDVQPYQPPQVEATEFKVAPIENK